MLSFRPRAPRSRIRRGIPFALCTAVALVAPLACYSREGADKAAPVPATPADAGEVTRTSAAGDDVPHLPCDVSAILREHCQTCHGREPAFGAPFALMTYHDLTANAAAKPAPDTTGVPAGALPASPPGAPSTRILDRVIARARDDARPMPPPPNGRLTPAEIGVFSAWAEAGAPASGTTCDSPDAGKPPSGRPLSCTPDLHLAPATKWAMTNKEEYVCFGADVTVAQKRHVIAFAPRVDNRRMLHHMTMYKAPASVDASPAPCSAGGSADWQLVYAWAPGGQNLELPKEAGLPEEGTTHYVVQLHYTNYAALTDTQDGSGIDACTTETLRPNDAEVMAFGSTNFAIPARSRKDMTCRMPIPASWPTIHAFSVFPHMHTMGSIIQTWAVPGGGGPSNDMAMVTAWDFANQPWLTTNVDIHPGDVVNTRCVWNNKSDTEATFGEDATDEMCYAYTMYYPRLNVQPWDWSTPADEAQCDDTVQGP